MPRRPARKQPSIAAAPADLNAAADLVWRKARRAARPTGIAYDLARMLAPVIDALAEMVDSGRAAEAEPVLRRIVARSHTAMRWIDDSGGSFHPLCNDAVELWGRAWARIEPRNPKKLAQLVEKFTDDGGDAIRDDLLEDFAESLGEEGCAVLRARLEKRFAALPPIEGSPRSNPRETEEEREARYKREHERSSILSRLKTLADIRNDVDDFTRLIALDDRRFDGKKGLSEYARREIAKRLCTAGRFEEALAFLGTLGAIDEDPFAAEDEEERDDDADDGADENADGGQDTDAGNDGLDAPIAVDRRIRAARRAFDRSEGERLRRRIRGLHTDNATVRADALLGLGRRDEAFATLWADFIWTLAPETLARLVEISAESARPGVRRDAIARARVHPEVDVGILFLSAIAELDEAAALIVARERELDGRQYSVLTQLAKRLAKSHPVASWVSNAALLASILKDARRTAYWHAAQYLFAMRALAASHPAELAERQAALDAELTAKHARKSAFWAEVEAETARVSASATRNTTKPAATARGRRRR